MLVSRVGNFHVLIRSCFINRLCRHDRNGWGVSCNGLRLKFLPPTRRPIAVSNQFTSGFINHGGPGQVGRLLGRGYLASWIGDLNRPRHRLIQVVCANPTWIRLRRVIRQLIIWLLRVIWGDLDQLMVNLNFKGGLERITSCWPHGMMLRKGTSIRGSITGWRLVRNQKVLIVVSSC